MMELQDASGHERKINKLRTGIVIDHIPQYHALHVAELLGLADGKQGMITIGLGLESRKLGRKDIIHIENKTLSEKELSVIALVAPGATINVLEEYIVIKKFTVSLPDEFEDVLACANANCITNKEKVQTLMHRRGYTLRCHFCEHEFPLHELSILR